MVVNSSNPGEACRAEQFGLGQVAREFDGQVGFVGVSNNDTVAEGRKYQQEFEVSPTRWPTTPAAAPGPPGECPTSRSR